jgi:hypothetical protein
MNNTVHLEADYLKEDVTINIIWANIFGIIVLTFSALIFGWIFYLFWPEKIQTIKISNHLIDSQDRLLITIQNIGICFAILLPGIIVHELIHGIFFSIFTKDKFKSIKFGIMPAKKLFSPYCHCKEKLRINTYRLAIIAPLIIMGIIPAIISIIIGNMGLLFWGIIFIVAASGDILIFIKTIKEKNNTWIYDHPTEGGYFVYRKINKE